MLSEFGKLKKDQGLIDPQDDISSDEDCQKAFEFGIGIGRSHPGGRSRPHQSGRKVRIQAWL